MRALVEVRFYRASGEHGFLSNLYPVHMEFEGRWFESAEHAYQFGKPRHADVAEWMRFATRPWAVAFFAHAMPPWAVRKDWNEIKVDRMRRVLEAKFSRYALRDKLLATGSAYLVEASRTDAFWGVGRRGDGQNTLGLLLMELRERLREAGRLA